MNIDLKMASKICTFNCRGFNLCKIKHIETLLANCDILLIQETWALPDQVGKLNRYFDEYNTYGVSGINYDYSILMTTHYPYTGTCNPLLPCHAYIIYIVPFLFKLTHAYDYIKLNIVIHVGNVNTCSKHVHVIIVILLNYICKGYWLKPNYSNCEYYINIDFTLFIHMIMLMFHVSLHVKSELLIVYYTCTFDELAGINKEAVLTLKRYMYYVLYINHTCNSGPIFNVLQMLRIFQKRIISYQLIVTLCDGELHFIDNQAVHSNLQNYNLSIGSLLIICTRYFCNNILYTYCLYRYVFVILWFFHCHADGHSIRALLSVLTGAVR